jgi:hypothetical protein
MGSALPTVYALKGKEKGKEKEKKRENSCPNNTVKVPKISNS